MATRLPGYYRREPGAARRYVGPAGERLSYRQYRARVEAAGRVERLSPVDLANARRRQRAFNDIINQIAKVRGQALDNAIDNAVAAGAPPETVRALRTERRTLKSAAIKSPTRKQALKDLEKFHHKKDAASQLRTKEALIALGRRAGVPEWVPVGASDKFKTGRLRPPRGLRRAGR